MNSKTPLIATVSLILAMLIWGSSFIALKDALVDTKPYTIIFFRMFSASLLFLLFLKQFLQYKLTKKDIKYLLLLSLFEPALYFLFEVNALRFTSASQAGVISSIMPLITALLAGVILKELITAKVILGSIISMFGVIILSVSAETTQSAQNPLLGNLLELGAMTCGAGYTIVAKHLSKKFSALFITASQSFLGALFFFPFFLYEISQYPFTTSVNSMLWILYLGIVVTLGGYGLYNFALTKIDASKAAVFVNLIPIFSVLLGYIILKETLTTVQIFAAFLIIFGVAVSQYKYK